MILSFINIRKDPREVLKTSGFVLGYQHFPRDLAYVDEWKIIFDPSIVKILHYFMSMSHAALTNKCLTIFDTVEYV